MTFKRLALKLGLTQIEKLLQPSTIDLIKPETAIAVNVWALAHESIREEPFPSVGFGDLVLRDGFDITWGRVWGYQRQFWLLHKDSGVKSRWINGRTAPMNVTEKSDEPNI